MSPPSANNDDKKKWQGSGPGDSPGGSSKGKRIFILAAILSALAAAVAVLILLPKSGDLPFVLTLSIREYKDDVWPTNPFAVQDGDVLTAEFPKDKTKSAYNSQTKGRMLRELEDLPQDSDSPLVVHLCAHAVARNNDVFLIPGDASPDRSGGWVSLSSILDILQKNKNRRKLLILDVMRLRPNVRLGIVYQDVSTHIDALLKKRAKDETLPFFVLTACSDEQQSHIAGHLQRSAFAFYLDRGLRGAADGWNDDRKNDSVMVRELAGYVEKQIHHWAETNRDARQTPRLYGECTDFRLARLDPNAEKKEATQPKLRTYPDWLTHGWRKHDAWRNDRLYLYAPRPFKLFETLLIRAEERWRGGIEPKRVRDAFLRDSRVLEERMRYALEKTRYQTHSIALEQSYASLPKFEVIAEPLPIPKKKEKAKAEKKTDKEEKKEPPKKLAPVDPASELKSLVDKLESGMIDFSDEKKKLVSLKEFAAFWKKTESIPTIDTLHTIMQYAGAPLPLSQERVQFLYELVHSLKPPRPFAETLVIDRLEQWHRQAVDIGWPWSDDAARRAVTTTLRAERVFASLHGSPGALPWVRDALNKADDLRRQGEALLFSGQPAQPKKALPLLAQAEQQYLRIEGIIATITEAFADHATALVELPTYPSTFISTMQPTQDEKDAWLNAVRNTLALHELLKKPSISDLVRIDEAHKTLRQSLNRLASLFAERKSEPFNSDRLTVKNFLEQQSLLKSPLISSEDRTKLWSRSQEAAAKLHRRALAGENSISRDTSLSNATSTTFSELRRRQWSEAHRRAWYHVQLLKLSGLSYKKLEEQLAAIKESREPAKWHAFAAELAVAWNVTLPKEYIELKSQPFESMRLSYFFSWYNSHREWDNDPFHWTHNPAVAFHRQSGRDFWTMLADRCRREHQTTATWPGKSNLYSNAATEYSR